MRAGNIQGSYKTPSWGPPMSKKDGAKKETKPKPIKEQIKALEEKAFGMTNRKQKAAILKQIEALSIKDRLEKKEKMEKEALRKIPVRQVIPVGADPKTVQCINFLNKICPDGESCRFAHETVKRTELAKEEREEPVSNRICQFLIDALNAGEYKSSWTCPYPKCKNIHRLVDIKDESGAELSLEEYIELSRQSLSMETTPVTEESFKEWKLKMRKEEELHQQKVQEIACRGADLFRTRSELFKDDEEAGELDYRERCYSDAEEEC
jgi:hypothetical protein